MKMINIVTKHLTANTMILTNRWMILPIIPMTFMLAKSISRFRVARRSRPKNSLSFLPVVAPAICNYIHKCSQELIILTLFDQCQHQLLFFLHKMNPITIRNILHGGCGLQALWRHQHGPVRRGIICAPIADVHYSEERQRLYTAIMDKR